MHNFNFVHPQKLSFGEKSLQTFVEEFGKFPAQKPLIVLSDRALHQPDIDKFLKQISSHNIDFEISTNVTPEAPEELVAEIASDYKSNNCDGIIAIGGGSTIDLAKAATIIISNGGKIQDYYGLDTFEKQIVPKIFIPTTSGTGSESSNIIVLSNKEQKYKKGIVSNNLFADWVILDPELTHTMPEELTLATGLDAFSQSIEAYTSRNANPLVDLYAIQSMKLIRKNLEGAMNNEKGARENMSLAAYLSGIVISGGNAGTNLAHAIGNTIGAIYHTPHGTTVTSVLKEVLEFNSKEEGIKEKITKLRGELGEEVLRFIESIDAKFNIPSLSILGIKETELEDIADKILNTQQRLLANNLKEVNKSDLIGIMQRSM
ncbi:iron-containing alcohol dehydrogenase [Candidatus Dojkabacteria bacterium]|nr:iron-containing alcohol dehydrogenase [Candidatus Dojkabacteria bacterium]